MTGNLADLEDTEVFEGIFSCNVVQFLEDRAAFLTRARHHLRPGGLLVSTHQPRMRGASRDHAERMAARLREELAQTGYRDVREEWLDLRPVPVVGVVAARA